MLSAALRGRTEIFLAFSAVFGLCCSIYFEEGIEKIKVINMPFAIKKDQKYSYKDYLDWPDDFRCELIGGYIYDMTPAPSRKHQDISGELFGQIWNLLKEKKCRVYHAPFDVKFPGNDASPDKINSVVQPDIVIVCDEKKLDDRGCTGAPDLIVEIISEASASKDMKIKFSLYEKQGVREYWIVQPDEKIVLVFSLKENGEYGKPGIYSHEDKINPGIIEGLTIDLAAVFNRL